MSDPLFDAEDDAATPLTPDERATLQSLSAEGNIRLEQERIPWSYALARLGVS